MGKRKIGILTYWGVANYGAWTQAYALNNVLKELCAEEDVVEHISYLEQSHWDMYYAKDERLLNSFSYSWREIPHTVEYNKEELEKEKFEVLITGSDAIWEFSNPGFADDYHMIGHSVHSEKLYSYAASFGDFELYPEIKSIIADGIKKYNRIAVRDQHSVDILNQISQDISPVVVLDPALLWDFKKDRNVVKPMYRDYIAVYGASWDEEFICNAKVFAAERDLKLISIGYVNNWCDMSLKLIELRALEWIGMLANASYVFTSTFHGLMLGLNFEKQVKFYQTSYVKNRSQTLIEELKIPNHVDNFDAEIDYAYANERLRQLRERSITYLKEMISE